MGALMFESLDIASPVSSQTHVDWSGVCWGLWCTERVGSGITGWCPSPASFLGQGSRDQRFPPGSFLAASQAQPGSMKPEVLVLICCCFSSSNWVRGATSAGLSLHLVWPLFLAVWLWGCWGGHLLGLWRLPEGPLQKHAKWSHAGLSRRPCGYWPYALTN